MDTKSSYGSLTAVLGWWTDNGRVFPWRQTTDAFRFLIAEMLLQRSRSGTVAGVYLGLFERWPGAEEISQADVDEIATVIGPLGLRGRAEKIKAVATAWIDSGDHLNSVKQLQELPGVGPYIANATATAMSWESGPCFDSVSIRVMRRYLGQWAGDIPDVQVASQAYLQVPKTRWRELNWSILDLAAALCMPRVPRCHSCPLEEHCKWAEKQRQKPI